MVVACKCCKLAELIHSCRRLTVGENFCIVLIDVDTSQFIVIDITQKHGFEQTFKEFLLLKNIVHIHCLTCAVIGLI